MIPILQLAKWAFRKSQAWHLFSAKYVWVKCDVCHNWMFCYCSTSCNEMLMLFSVSVQLKPSKSETQWNRENINSLVGFVHLIHIFSIKPCLMLRIYLASLLRVSAPLSGQIIDTCPFPLCICVLIDFLLGVPTRPLPSTHDILPSPICDCILCPFGRSPQVRIH